MNSIRPIRFIPLAFVLCVAFLAGGALAAPPTGTFAAKLNASALPAGQTGVVAVVVEINAGLHAQSHTPLADNLIKFEVMPEANPALEFLDPIYPREERKTFAGLGEQSVYTGKIIVFIPFRIKADAAAGDIKINGKVTWQACNDKVCFAPERNKPFSIETKIVPASMAVTPENVELFTTFDSSIFAKGTTQPATQPAAGASSIEVDFFGSRFLLNSFALALPVALAVGILFNLMPCVLPVVPLKIIGFVKVSENDRARCFLLGGVFSLGVVAVFALLAQLIVVTHWLQWGELFGKGWFIWPMVAILLAMAMGQFGLFDVILPSRIYELSPSHETLVGNFLFGALTALLSTPCTAPMFAALLTWSLKQPSIYGVVTIYTVGIGMALPYLVLSAFPDLIRDLPRTGKWSVVLKQMMGFLVLAVAVYFAGGRLFFGRGFIWAVYAVIAAAMLFLMIRTTQIASRARPMIVSYVIAAMVIGGSLAFTLRLVSGLDWQPFSAAALQSAQASGKPVLVEFTANWCGNCLALEGSVYHDKRTALALRRDNVILLRADLTASDAPGWDMVNQLNPGGGIPLTAIYGMNKADPIKLTSLYTTQNLMDALDRAKAE